MALKFGSNTISTSGNYAKFGSDNLTTVKFNSNTVWQKVTGYTLTLSGVNGYWSKTSITGIPNGTSYSFNASTKTLTVGSQTATFNPYTYDTFDSYAYSSISSSSGTITGNKTITAYATPTYTSWTGDVSIDGIYNTQETISLTSFSQIKIFYDILAFNPSTNQVDYTIPSNTLIISRNSGDSVYLNESDYGELGVTFTTTTNSLTIGVGFFAAGYNGVVILAIYEIRGVS